MTYNNWNQPNQFPTGGTWEDQSSFSYDMGSSDFGQEQQFQTFDYTSVSQPSGGCPSQPYISVPQPTFFTPGPTLMTPGPTPQHTSDSIEDEPPLLEELGIDPDAIVVKTLNVLNPLRNTDPAILQDTDLAGPMLFCLAFGSFLLLSGKIHFGYIYGIGMLGCIAVYALLNLMSLSGVAFGVVVSVLGYCILPMVVLAGINVMFSLQGIIGCVLTVVSILWCAWSASKLFVTALNMHHQQPLVAYPCSLFYAVFALITIF